MATDFENAFQEAVQQTLEKAAHEIADDIIGQAKEAIERRLREHLSRIVLNVAVKNAWQSMTPCLSLSIS